MEDRRLSLALSSDYGWDYDVFLSFRGLDTGKHFAGNLYYALKQRGIRTFYADRELEGGEELEPTLLKRIQDSKTAIPVFSRGYADSAFCLLELAAIMDNSKAKGRLVFPVFYGVSASDVRRQTGTYEEAMAKHQRRNDHHVVQKWREALQQAANLSGSSFKFQNEYEFEFIEKIIEVVSKNVNRTLLCVAKHPVGLESLVQEVCKLLDVGPGCNKNQVCMVGIHGIGGIGKSTLAKAVFNYIADQFDSSCFLENVRENSSKHGLEHLQAKLLFDIVGEKNISLIGPSEGVPPIKHRLRQKKVLLILDDVDEEKQLKELAGGLDWFGSGSRVIITTQDQQALRLHGIKTKYELNGLKFEDARKLFELKLKKKADPHFDDVINRAVTYCAKHPLALELISSDLGSINADEWESALGHYERNLGKEIYDKLKRSFDRLEKEVQSVFLDIACCFKGLSRTEVNNMLRAHHGFCPIYAIRLLEEKSLIMIEDNEVRLHDKIHEMGRKIEQEGKHGHRYLLSSYEAIVQFFKHKGIHDKIEMIILDLSSSEEQVVEWDGEGFKDMESLKTLINRNVYFSQDPNHLPNSLRVFEWPGYSSHSLPANFCPKELILFKLPSNRLMSLNFLKASSKTMSY
ncbi:disease resistance protein Roq1-like [Arachis stenosperma]|uniref:disease resistance protein Roq1-like n=1 Tax=Arachis stenosperma TaxID=217475 RepID=UPI0025AD09D0|nr:disease resistance protein Roq1-like [Arachis stenosperma]